MAYISAIDLSSDIILCRLKTIETFSYFSIIIISIIIIIIVMIDIIIYLFNITFLSTINRSL